jgi:hypothetical protein
MRLERREQWWGRAARASIGLIVLIVASAASVGGVCFADPGGVKRSRAEASARPHLRLVWVDPGRQALLAFEGMATESHRLLQRMGVEAVWTRGQAGGPLPDALPVVLMRSSGRWSARDRHVMGAAPRSEGPAPAVWVYFQEVAWALGLDATPIGSWTAENRRSFELALGRVVAHELVHAVLPDRPHARAGLMSERMHRSILVAQELDIDPPTCRAFGEAVALREVAEETPLL